MIPFLWGLLGVILIFVQFQVDPVELIFPAAGAFIVALLSLIPVIGGNFWLQLGLWGVISFVSLIFLRKKFKKIFTGNNIKEDKEEFSGQMAHVTEFISPELAGRISFQGTTWIAQSLTETIPVGAEVMILQKDGLHFVVTQNRADQFLLEIPIKEQNKEE